MNIWLLIIFIAYAIAMTIIGWYILDREKQNTSVATLLKVLMLIFSVGIIVLFVYVYINDNKEESKTSEKYDNCTQKKRNSHEFVKIHKTIDDEHFDIMDAIDNLYDVCENHWKTEDKFYKEGLSKMPPHHHDTSAGWAAHTKEHKSFLKSIKDMKGQVRNHIKKYDTRDFHWL